MRVHVSAVPSGSDEWTHVATVSGVEEGGFGITTLAYRTTLALPDGEQLELAGRYDPVHRGINIAVFAAGRQLADLGGFKADHDGFDPSMAFLTPTGNYLQVLLGA
jgi:hypothetical protein